MLQSINKAYAAKYQNQPWDLRPNFEPKSPEPKTKYVFRAQRTVDAVNTHTSTKPPSHPLRTPMGFRELYCALAGNTHEQEKFGNLGKNWRRPCRKPAARIQIR
jgi:hypothetical protein